jgi:hypothetical protein
MYPSEKLSDEVGKMLLENENSRVFAKLTDFAQKLAKELGEADTIKLIDALNAEANFLLSNSSKTSWSKKEILAVLENSHVYEKFLESDYFGEMLKDFDRRVLHNPYYPLLNPGYTGGQGGPSERPACRVNGGTLKWWQCLIIIVIIIIIIILL